MRTTTMHNSNRAGNGAGNSALNQGGFSMLEVLISLVLIAVAMLGQAGLQVNALRFAKGAATRMQAVFLSNEIAERIESNKLGATAGNYAVATASSTPSTSSTDCTVSACSSSVLAAYDLAEWTTRVSAALPSPTWQITNTIAGNPSTYTIIVSWQERRSDANTTTYATTGTPDTSTLTSIKVVYQ
jgi:type IV pilus assembly protein PilV